MTEILCDHKKLKVRYTHSTYASKSQSSSAEATQEAELKGNKQQLQLISVTTVYKYTSHTQVSVCQ